MRASRLLLAALSTAIGAAAASLGGCGAAAPPPPTTVRGRVLFQGAPLVGGMVVFAPDPDRGNGGGPLASSETDTAGEFRLRVGASDEVPAGWYRVALADPPPDPLTARWTTSPGFPPRTGRGWRARCGPGGTTCSSSRSTSPGRDRRRRAGPSPLPVPGESAAWMRLTGSRNPG